MAKILVIRFSAVGDVAMTIPVLHSFALQYPEHEITILSKSFLESLFVNMPANVSFKGVDFNKDYKGIGGLNRLFKELSQENFDYIGDFHDVLRSQYLRLRFKMQGKRVSVIDKGRRGKQKLVRPHYKVMQNQPSSFKRYADVLKNLGFPLQINFNSLYGDHKGDIHSLNWVPQKTEDSRWVGVAPFAKHAGKIYPLDLMEKVIKELSQDKNITLFLFGNGKQEEEVFNKWSNLYPNVISTLGRSDMSSELALMSHLEVMISMDSANMHLASLVNTPVVSIWGATHPYCGFMGWKQLPINAIQVDLACRPCSVFGNKPCRREDYACLTKIEPAMIVKKVQSILY